MEQKFPEPTRAGDANRITREYLDSLLLELRYLDAVVPSTTLELYGETFATPIMTGALSHLDRFRPNGMVELAKGALAAQAVYWAGFGDEAELESIVATGARTIVVLKPYADETVVLRRIAHAKSCGVLGIGMDVDHSFNQKGELGSVLGVPMGSKSTDDIRRYVQAAGDVPFLLKGVLSVQDARKGLEAGVRGLVLSHHHGIQDFAAPPLMVLPEILRVVGDRMPVFVDCMITTGVDAFKALALGATAVSVGRGLLDALSEEGADGVCRKIQEITGVLAAAMGRTCSPDLRHIDPTVIRTS
jgi:isopentenyl diphosphate isomerase/L-lactate dehydrogenase-like FMN-dependent dehydrogenase